MTAAYTSELAEALSADVLDRLLRYVRIDTQSDRAHAQSPSTPGQLELGRLLVDELRGLGLSDAAQDANGFVTATLPGTVDGAPVIGLLAHLDTSPDESGANVEPLVHRDYDGGVIALPRRGTVLDPAHIPELTAKVGHDLVTTSGDTLLGADDKAGMAEVMAAVAYLAAHPELPRPTLRVGFTPDEEIGEGAKLFDIDAFGAACAYTFDGSEAGEFTDETFTAASADVVIHGVEVHPGFATGKLVNASRLAGRVLTALPAELTPEATSEREGFIHVYSVESTAGEATIRTIVRDFDDERLAEHVALLRRTAEEVVASDPRARLEVEVKHQYPNMRTFLDRHPGVSDAAEEALRREGFEPKRVPIRGGTDGSILSARGLPTPNLFTGGHEYHSVREWASVQDMASAAAVAVRLAGVWAERAG
ncbi:MAG TPA: peptidase T [Solirubrobacteraceae bacterium]|nr:peptidase T [Solirubrobacteraceae bacterium]